MKNNKDQANISRKIKANCRNFLNQNLNAYGNVLNTLALSDEELAHMQTIANDLITQKRYSEAANAFIFLATIAGNRLEFWIGLGMASQLQGDFEVAIDAYEVAASCAIDHPLPYLYLGNAYFAIHKREQAYQAIDLALTYAADKSAYEEIAQKASKAKAQLEKYLD
jgi:type III secretion system low calcium response chaperone LcrH/SycD